MPSTYPLYLRRLMQETTIYFAQCYEIARQRTLGSPSSFKRLMAERDEVFLDSKLLRREISVLRRNRESIPHQKRPDYLPHDRSEILQIMRLRQWSLRKTADHFVLHYNTVWNWSCAWRTDKNVGLFFGHVPWNKISDGIRWMVHQICRLCPEPEFGTRSIAMQLLRSGIQISRSSVQRILRENKPSKPPKPVVSEKEREIVTPHSILRPARINQAWHLDLTTLDLLFVRFYVAAVLDGFSRRLLALKVYPDAPTTAMILRLLRQTITGYGTPRFIVTDHGCQFRKRFQEALKAKFGIILVKGKVHSYYMNGKVERFFRTFNLWKRLKLFYASGKSIQKKLDVYRMWYNIHRPQWNLGKRTPEEVWKGVKLPESILIAERNPIKPAMNVRKQDFKGDPGLSVIEIEVVREARRAAA